MLRAHQLLQKQYLIIHPTADGTEAPSCQLNWQLWCFVNLFHLFSAEKVHFQHTAKLINHLISEKANYTLQVRLRPVLGARSNWPTCSRTCWGGSYGDVFI